MIQKLIFLFYKYKKYNKGIQFNGQIFKIDIQYKDISEF